MKCLRQTAEQSQTAAYATANWYSFGDEKHSGLWLYNISMQCFQDITQTDIHLRKVVINTQYRHGTYNLNKYNGYTCTVFHCLRYTTAYQRSLFWHVHHQSRNLVVPWITKLSGYGITTNTKQDMINYVQEQLLIVHLSQSFSHHLQLVYRDRQNRWPPGTSEHCTNHT